MTFELIGQKLTFRVRRIYINVAGIKCVHGITLDNKQQTIARVEDCHNWNGKSVSQYYKAKVI